jgi:hypothetical protein
MKRIFITTLLISLIGLLNLTAQERIYTPELMLPENGAVDQMPDVVLDWNAVTGGNTGIIKYDIQLDCNIELILRRNLLLAREGQRWRRCFTMVRNQVIQGNPQGSPDKS